ncbi:MAG TPA: glutamate racemase [Candidatus Paceibacterota bacterium]|nr:glutamate racemase [Verrucomicrobiota bacterium]HRY47363.1 glutamate racemase [Candidatus Paceibacterota bacterium]
MTSTSRLPIGIFDSGVGGLTVVRQIHRLMPHEDVLYLGDTARVPYGTKSPTTVIRFACEDTRFLERQKIKAVVVACNTASAWSLPTLEHHFSLPIYGVVVPGAEEAVRKTRQGRIGIIGTAATIRSQAYVKAIHALKPDAQVFVQSCPLLVPLVEEGWLHHAITVAALKEYLAPLLRKKIDVLILGCTHYPLLKPAIRRLIGPGIRLVDSAETCARYVQRQLVLQALAAPGNQRGRIQPFVTDEAEHFDKLARRFLRSPTERAWQVDLASF